MNKRFVTRDKAMLHIPERKIPDFWVGNMDKVYHVLENVRRGEVKQISSSAGGHPVNLVSYGETEIFEQRANFCSAIAAAHPEFYIDKQKRDKPVVMFVGPVHGHEVEGLTGLMNLISIFENGTDLSGKPHEDLFSLADKCRVLILPCVNPDGVYRFAPQSLNDMEEVDLRFWGQGTWADDSLCGYPWCKCQHPRRMDDTGFLGCYFNDAGINIMHDNFFFPMCEESMSILDVARREGPDIVLHLHSHESAPAFLRPAFVPQEMQKTAHVLAARTYRLFDEYGLPHQEIFRIDSDSHTKGNSLNMVSAIYHICGATSVNFECPHGLSDMCQVSFYNILDIQLLLYKSVLLFALGM